MSSDAVPKAAMQPRSTGLRPYRSPSLPQMTAPANMPRLLAVNAAVNATGGLCHALTNWGTT
jgi:hypothetical protein